MKPNEKTRYLNTAPGAFAHGGAKMRVETRAGRVIDARQRFAALRRGLDSGRTAAGLRDIHQATQGPHRKEQPHDATRDHQPRTDVRYHQPLCIRDDTAPALPQLMAL